ncbi:DUF4388 domain-containing protein [Ktedonobacter racemifer]|uniref:PatA-like N-terminal domain-containing protein n=1 Tax=Ktedonobacter racemifer DSM 44963 TaxID=485913 RepID=D6U4G6_KTERA|nr:DUF4388 domain-containing protein [Ktedonobacter racemifer]EFH81396.1 hypothetical protein Krac_2114 [Ktedonobacter racemifer DSM 44963]
MPEQEPQQGWATKLETFLQNLADEQRSGVLDLERSKAGVKEKGRVILLHGGIVEVSVGTRTGEEALNWLLAWGQCRYTFALTSPMEMEGTFPQRSQPTSDPIVMPPQTPIPPASIQPRSNTLPPGSYTPNIPPAHTNKGPFAPNTLLPFQNASVLNSPPTNSPKSPAYSSWDAQQAPAGQETTLVPYRLLQGPDAISLIGRYPLTRSQRHLYFLLDEQRTIVDLARLTGNSILGVRQLLIELEQMGLVRFKIAS